MQKKSYAFVLLIIFLASIGFAGNPQQYVTENIEQDVNDLLAQMTLEEKIGQLVQYSGVNSQKEQWLRQGMVGSFLGVMGGKETNRVQRIAVEETRLGIPLLFGLDVIHGYRTISPILLGETATWNPLLVEKSARIAAIEASASGINWTFAPMVDIARDARWGRIAEGSGEDPYLGSVMAAARVRGFQGKDLTLPNTIAACAKHYAAYGGAEAGKDYNTVDISLVTLRNVYLPPFKSAVEVGVSTLMSAFNEISGIPCSGNKLLLTKILRQEWGFDGFVVSDWDAVKEMVVHGNAANEQEAGKLALEAGVDMEMVSGIYFRHFADMVKQGMISEELIDRAVRRVLRIKFRLGLFEHPYVDPARENKEVLTPEHRQLARKIAAESIVLLKNEKNILPLNKAVKSIAVIGPLAKDKRAPLGSWSCAGKPEDVVNLFDGIKKKVAKNTIIYYAKGCEIQGGDKKDFAEAISLTRKADVVLLAVGEGGEMSGEAASRSFLGLPGHQLELAKEIIALGKPTVVILMSGRPLAIPWIAGNATAILETWFLGVECGNAIADVVFGNVNPSGKLPVSFPRATGQEPLYYNHKNTGRPATEFRYTSKYLDVAEGPLYPFGYGLSYTNFEYQNLTIDKTKIKPYGKVSISVEVKNVGRRTGQEIVQLYIRDLVGTLTRPVRQLKGFKKITLKPGEKQKVVFTLGHDDLGYYNQYDEYVVEPGLFKFWTGPNSVEGLEGSFEVIR